VDSLGKNRIFTVVLWRFACGAVFFTLKPMLIFSTLILFWIGMLGYKAAQDINMNLGRSKGHSARQVQVLDGSLFATAFRGIFLK